MNRAVELLREAVVAAVQFAGPTTVSAALGAAAGIVAALVVVLLGRALIGWIRGRRVRVASLVRQGASRAEIARRTGLSQDAVGMLLRVRGSHRGRRNLPPAARIAAPNTANAHRRNRYWNPQAMPVQRFTASDRSPAGSARALPSPGPSATRLTRSGQAA